MNKTEFQVLEGITSASFTVGKTGVPMRLLSVGIETPVPTRQAKVAHELVRNGIAQVVCKDVTGNGDYCFYLVAACNERAAIINDYKRARMNKNGQLMVEM